MSARIVVTLICEYEGDSVDDYDVAMDAAAAFVAGAGDDLIEQDANVRVVEVQVTG